MCNKWTLLSVLSSMHLPPLIALLGACTFFAGCAHRLPATRHVQLTEHNIAVLDALRDDINSEYGLRDKTPRINLGPCGRFAKTFREEWNARFAEKVNIVFVMSPNGAECYHVLVRLPNGDYYDGGNGVISGPALLEHYIPGTTLDEMLDFDFARLDKWSYGLTRKYDLCPNYSDDTTLRLITHHLDRLSSTIRE
jgi:hypothetical protein